MNVLKRIEQKSGNDRVFVIVEELNMRLYL